MSAKPIAALLFLLIAPVAAQAGSTDDENAQLRAQIATLKAQNEALQRACPAAASINTTSATAAAAVAPAAAPTAPVTTAMAAEVPPAAVAPAAPSKPPKLYANIGCDRGLFSGPAPGKWQDSKAWKTIGNGSTMAEVESTLGVEHYNEEKGKAVQWQYGRCSGSWESSVTFVNGVAVSISPP